MSARRDPELFEIPVERLRSGYYTDAYFNKAKAVLELEDHHPRVLMQVFQRHHAVLGGIEEAIAVIEAGAGRRTEDGGWEPGWDKLEVRALEQGARIEPEETVMTIEGDYSLFAHLETVYLGVLARGTLIATNVTKVLEAANGKEVLFFPARHDHYAVQAANGDAALTAGIAGVTTNAEGSRHGIEGVGTLPHALIAAYNGDTIAAAEAYARHFGGRIIVLVDFDNDSVNTSIAVADRLGERLWGVRLDTSGSLIDRSLADAPGPEEERRGVTPELVRRVRAGLDAAGHEHVRIVVSGGFNAERVARFEAEGAPVDVYGVGSSLLRGEYDFTADVVRVEGRPMAKVGRRERPNPRLRPVN